MKTLVIRSCRRYVWVWRLPPAPWGGVRVLTDDHRVWRVAYLRGAR